MSWVCEHKNGVSKDIAIVEGVALRDRVIIEVGRDKPFIAVTYWKFKEEYGQMVEQVLAKTQDISKATPLTF